MFILTEDEKIQRIIAENRHNQLTDLHTATNNSITELISSLKDGIVTDVSKDVEKIIEVIGKQAKSIETYYSQLSTSIDKATAAMEVKPNLSNENGNSVVSSIEELKAVIASGQIEINEGQQMVIQLLLKSMQPKEWEFTFEKEWDRIVKVKAKQIIHNAIN